MQKETTHAWAFPHLTRLTFGFRWALLEQTSQTKGASPKQHSRPQGGGRSDGLSDPLRFDAHQGPILELKGMGHKAAGVIEEWAPELLPASWKWAGLPGFPPVVVWFFFEGRLDMFDSYSGVGSACFVSSYFFLESDLVWQLFGGSVL